MAAATVKAGAQTLVRNPWWLYIVLAFGTAAVALAAAHRDRGRERRFLEEFYLQKGEAVIRTLAGAAFRGWTDISSAASLLDLQGMLDEGDEGDGGDGGREGGGAGRAEHGGHRGRMACGRDGAGCRADGRPGGERRGPVYLALTDMEGIILSSSAPPDAFGEGTFRDPGPPEAFRGPWPKRRVSEAGGREVFWVYRPLRFAAEPAGRRWLPRTRPPRRQPRNGAQAAPGGGGPPDWRGAGPGGPPLFRRAAPGSADPRSVLYFWVAFDMADFEAAERDARADGLIFVVLTALAAFAMLLCLVWANNYRISRNRERDAAARAEEIYNRMPAALFLTDPGGRVTLANEEAGAVAGLPRRDLLGKTLGELTGGTFPEGREIAGVELDVEFAGGRRARVSVTAGPFLDHSGAEAGRVVLAADVGHIAQLRAQLAEKERLAALGDLSRAVAHEIRNPLSSIKGLAQHLLGREHAPGIREALENILAGVERMSETVTEFMDYGRPCQVRTRPVAMGPFLERLHDLILHDDDWCGAGPELAVPRAPLVAMADPRRLAEAFLNLYLNALQATAGNSPDSPPRVEAELTRGPGGEAIVTFTDNGPGFPGIQLARPFQPYFTSKAKGTGLGLAHVKKIIDAHGGTVTLGNREEGGAIVTVTLPPAPPGAIPEEDGLTGGHPGAGGPGGEAGEAAGGPGPAPGAADPAGDRPPEPRPGPPPPPAGTTGSVPPGA
ncbi:MAG: PAS domain-containing protein [Deltaproteobacteria bacterium]|jgi:two-component system sensor histidine kinase HydH|nr:PAS domain-containing protein [Deltaproteobacteria bacterium]